MHLEAICGILRSGARNTENILAMGEKSAIIFVSGTSYAELMISTALFVDLFKAYVSVDWRSSSGTQLQAPRPASSRSESAMTLTSSNSSVEAGSAQQGSVELHTPVCDHCDIQLQQLWLSVYDLQNDYHNLQNDYHNLHEENQALRADAGRFATPLREDFSFRQRPGDGIWSTPSTTGWTSQGQELFEDFSLSSNAPPDSMQNSWQPSESAGFQVQSSAVNMANAMLHEDILDNTAPQSTSSASVNLPRENPVPTANSITFSDTHDSSLLQASPQTGPSISGSLWSDDTLPVEGDNGKSMQWGPLTSKNQGGAQSNINRRSFLA